MSLVRGGSNAVLRVAGELDLATAHRLDETLRRLEEHGQAPPRRVVIEADQLTFVDAAGLAPLLSAARRLPVGTLRLRNVQPPVLRVLRLLDLTATFGVDC